MNRNILNLTRAAVGAATIGIASAGLVASYDFKSGSLADTSGNGNDASVVGGIMGGAVIDDIRGEVFNLTGGSGVEGSPGTYLNLPVGGSATGSWTLTMWIYDGDHNGSGVTDRRSYLFDNRDFTGSGGGVTRLIFSTEHNTPSYDGIGLFAGVASGNGWRDGGSTPIRDGSWHHVAWVFDGGSGVLIQYTDGIANGGESVAAADLLAASVRLGNRSSDGAGGQSGRLIDDVYIYDNALNQQGIDDLIAATGPEPFVPLEFRIISMSADDQAGTVDLTWNSQNMGPLFDILGTEDLALPHSEWDLDGTEIPNNGDTTSAQVANVFGDRRFFAVRETPPPVSGGTELIPFPSSITVTEDPEYRFDGTSRIVYETRSAPRTIETSLLPLAQVLAGELEILTGTLPSVVEIGAAGSLQNSDIVLRFGAAAVPFPETEVEEDQSYDMTVTSSGVEITSAYYKGVAYGTATLLQSLGEDGSGFFVNAMTVTDQPDAGYRTIMLDVARQVHSTGVIEDVIRMARLFKIRYIQLHLTDDQNFTFPFTPVTNNLSGNYTFARQELEDLVSYADARGVTLIPELDLPGHSSKLKASGYLNPSSSDSDVADPANYMEIKAIIDDILSVFTSSPYFHIGGDESSAGGTTLINFLEEMNNHLRGTPTGGKRRMLVWEGFHGAPTTQIPTTGDDRVIVLSWESSYNPPWNLLSAGYEIINACWKPMYVVGGGTRFHPGSTSGKKFLPEDIHRWDKNLFMHWQPGTPVYNQPGHIWDAMGTGQEDQIIGGQLLFWEQEEKSVMLQMPSRLPAMAERLWNPAIADDFDTLQTRADALLARIIPIVQPVEILPLPSPNPDPIIDIYQPYSGSQLEVTLVNRTRIPGTIRYDVQDAGGNASSLTSIYFPSPGTLSTASTSYGSPFTASGRFAVRAQLFRTNGTPIDGNTWSMFGNFPNRVHVSEYDIGELSGSVVPDMAAQPVENLLREYGAPMLRGAFRNVLLVGQLQLADLTPPATGDYVLSMKTDSGHASLYLDVNRNGTWEVAEKLITDTPSGEVLQYASPVTLNSGLKYRLRVDHKSGIPRPVLVVYLDGPSTGGRQEISPWLSLPQ